MNIPMPKPNVWQRAVHQVAATGVGARLFSMLAPGLDRWFLRLSSGRHTLSSLLSGLPVVMVSTRGAKSKMERTVPLVPLVDGQKLALIASNFGGKNHPGWFYNLKADPKASVSYRGQVQAYLARLVHGDERLAYLRKAEEVYIGYRYYQQRAGRTVHVMVLEPVEACEESGTSEY